MNNWFRRSALLLAFVAMSAALAHSAHLDASHLFGHSHDCVVCHAATAADVPSAASAQPLFLEVTSFALVAALFSDIALKASAQPRGPPAA